MSAIDTLDHAHVGNFFGIPIYWILQEAELSKITDCPEDDGKIVNKYYMSVGGGSGEHPALILDNDALVFNFLIRHIQDELTFERHTPDYQLNELIQEIDTKYSTENDGILHYQLDQNQWPLETFINIHKKMNKIDKSSDSLQKRMKNSFALFIINEMPFKDCLKDPELIEIVSFFKEKTWENAFNQSDIEKKYIGIKLLSDKEKSGRIIVNNKVQWGYGLEDWKKDNQSKILAEKLSNDLPIKQNSLKIKI